MPKKPPSLKKLTLKIKYLNLELEEVKEIYNHYNTQWIQYIVSLEKTHRIEIFQRPDGKKEKSSKKDSDMDRVDLKRDRKQDEIFKTLYRDIAIQAHPDKTFGDEDKARLMRQATRAKNKDDLMTMLDICDTLDIKSPKLKDNHYKIIEKNIKKKEEEINRFKNLDAWVYGVAKEEADEGKLKAVEKAILNAYRKDK